MSETDRSRVEEHDKGVEPTSPSWNTEEAVPIGEIIRKLNTYRSILIWLPVFVAGMYVLAGLLLVVWLPVHKTVSLKFRLEFDGADRGEYPNSTKFSTSEIIATPILAAIHQGHSLEEYISFEDFSDAIFIREDATAIRLLEREYEARLSDRNMALIDRQRTEEEYQAKRSALKVTELALVFTLRETTQNMSTEAAGQFLEDILRTWAKTADEKKGALLYRVSVASHNLVKKEVILSSDYIVGLDMLRAKIQAVLEDIDKVAEIPGAKVSRVGEEQISLSEIRAHLVDTRLYRLEPLTAVVLANNLSKDRGASQSYFQTRLFQIELDSRETESRLDALENALKTYLQESGGSGDSSSVIGERGGSSVPTMIPQFGDSFLDRLIQMSSRPDDLQFRQELTERIVTEGLKRASLEKQKSFYESLLSRTKGFLTSSRVSQDSAKDRVVSQTNDILESLDSAIANLQEIYSQISIHNLHPETHLYRILKDSTTQTERSLSRLSVLLSAALVLLLSFGATLVGCFFHAYMAGGSSRST